MKDGLRRLLTLILVFIAAFALVFVVRQCQGGGSILGKWKKDNPYSADSAPGQHKKEEYALAEKPPLDLEDVDILSRLNDEHVRLVRAVTPSVVSIITPGVKRETVRDVFGREYEGRLQPTQGVGSGVIISAQGHIITNHHVIAGKGRYVVNLHDGKTYTAKLIGSDPALDVAVLRINADGPFKALKFGDSDNVEVGQKVFAVGNAFGLGESVTWGHISAKERSVTDTQRDLFQTDAAINPGNSGGPLVNLRGEVIGINVAIYSPDKKNRGFHGVGFSIPANDAKESFIAIVERGRPIRGYLGVVVLDMIPQIRQVLDYQEAGGAAVDAVTSGSPAEKAGLIGRDVIEKFDGVKVRSRAHLLSLIQRAKVDQEVKMVISRNGERLTLNPVISELDAEILAQQEMQSDPTATDREILDRVGIQARNLTVLERVRGAQGILVTGIVKESLMHKYGLKVGDVIIGINGVRVNAANDLYARLVASVPTQVTTIMLIRNGKSARIKIPMLEKQQGS